MQVNHKAVEKAMKGQDVCIKIDPVPGEAPKMYGRHFEHTDMLVSKVYTDEHLLFVSMFSTSFTQLITLQLLFSLPCCHTGDTVHWYGICYGDVAVCVCVYVTLMYCAQTTESITMQPSPDCSPVILVFHVPNMNPIVLGDPLIESVKWERGR